MKLCIHRHSLAEVSLCHWRRMLCKYLLYLQLLLQYLVDHLYLKKIICQLINFNNNLLISLICQYKTVLFYKKEKAQFLKGYSFFLRPIKFLKANISINIFRYLQIVMLGLLTRHNLVQTLKLTNSA